MSSTGLDVFDKTLQTTNIWLDEVMQEVGPDRQVAWKVLGTVLRRVRDRLPVELSAHLGAELPLLVRGAYYDQYEPSHQPARWGSMEEFLDGVSAGLANTRPTDPKAAARAVFRLLSRRLPAGQVAKVRQSLPAAVREAWEGLEEPLAAGAARA